MTVECHSHLKGSCRQTVSAGGLFVELPAWRPSDLVSPCQVLANTWVTHLLAKSSGWQLWQWQETRNPITLKAGFLAHSVGPLGPVGVFYWAALILHHSLEHWDYSKHYALVLPSAEKTRKERLYSLDSPLVVLGSSHMVWGVHLRTGVSWQRPNNGLHLSDCTLGSCCESSLLILTATLGGRW